LGRRFGYELWGTEVGIRFPAAKLLDSARHEAALELNPNPITVVVSAHLKTLHEFEKEKGMTFITTAERVDMEKGLAEGLEKGREEGREEGLLAGIEALLEV
jgi:flagellar biosynthesis/type III secretory pathway protein FliH